MPELHQLITEDSRPLLERIRRIDLEKVCVSFKLSFSHDASADVLRQLIRANGIDDVAIQEHIKCVQIDQKTANGGVSPQVYPERLETKVIDYDYKTKLEEKTETAEGDSDLQSVVKAQSKQIEELLEMNRKLLGSKADDPNWQDHPEQLHGKTLQKKLKELGIPVSRNDTKKQLLEKFNGYKNAS